MWFEFVGIAGAGGIDFPRFDAAGNAAPEAPVIGSLEVNYPSGIVAGHRLWLHVVVSDSGGPSITTPSGWTLVDSQVSSDTLVTAVVYWKIADGTETGYLSITCTADTFGVARIFRGTGGASTEAAGSATTDSSGTNMSAVNVTTLGAKRLVCQFLFAKVNTTIGDITGESGADYAEAFAEYSASIGPVIISLQTAQVESAGAVTGGSATLASAGTYRIRIAFAIVP